MTDISEDDPRRRRGRTAEQDSALARRIVRILDGGGSGRGRAKLKPSHSGMRKAAFGGHPPKRSGRVGAVNGHPTRTFFIRLTVAEKPVALAAYIQRAAGHRDEELECVGGMDLEAFTALMEKRSETVAEDKAKAYSLVFELPYEMPPAQREEVARRVAQKYEDWGVVWAIHSTNEEGIAQPHMHLEIAAGPYGERPVEGPEAMKELRAFVAETVNTVGMGNGERLPIEWHGGTLKDTGITRAPKPDVPRGLYRARKTAQAMEATGQPVPETMRRQADAADRIEAGTGPSIAQRAKKAAAAERVARELEEARAAADDYASRLTAERAAKASATSRNEELEREAKELASKLKDRKMIEGIVKPTVEEGEEKVEVALRLAMATIPLSGDGPEMENATFSEMMKEARKMGDGAIKRCAALAHDLTVRREHQSDYAKKLLDAQTPNVRFEMQGVAGMNCRMAGIIMAERGLEGPSADIAKAFRDIAEEQGTRRPGDPTRAPVKKRDRGGRE